MHPIPLNLIESRIKFLEAEMKRILKDAPQVGSNLSVKAFSTAQIGRLTMYDREISLLGQLKTVYSAQDLLKVMDALTPMCEEPPTDDKN